MINRYELHAMQKSFKQPNEIWKAAFKEYNEAHPYERPLTLNCVPCYFKVYKWHKNRLENDSERT